MRLVAGALIVCSAACTDPSIAMKMTMPSNAASYDTSCITAVEVRAVGMNYAQDSKDFETSCVNVTGATYADLDAAMAGKYDVAIPASGLLGIELHGWAGPAACTPPTDAFFTPDLMFQASQSYIGQDTIDLEVVPNLDCARTNVDVHVTDLFDMVAGAATDTNCATATTVTDGNETNGEYVAVGSLVTDPFADSLTYYGGNDFAFWKTNQASFQSFTQQVGAKACLALDTTNDAGYSTTCAITNPVCPGAGVEGEMEVTAVQDAVVSATAALVPTLTAKYSAVVFGSVWTGTTTKHAVSGATATVDPSQGTIVYIDPPPAGSSQIAMRQTQSTGASGMFLLYTNTVASVTINANGPTRTVSLGSTGASAGGAMILVN